MAPQGFDDLLALTPNEDDLGKHFEIAVPQALAAALVLEAHEMMRTAPWQGRDNVLKAQNFSLCYLSEWGFKTLLSAGGVPFESRALYRGSAANAPDDFRVGAELISIGIRSRYHRDLAKWREVPYPADRLLHEQTRIGQLTVVASVSGVSDDPVMVRFYGAIPKDILIAAPGHVKMMRSERNQEAFFPLPLVWFPFHLLTKLLGMNS